MLDQIIGAGVGGIMGALNKPPAYRQANFTRPDFQKDFNIGGIGTATKGGFQFQQDPNRERATKFASQQMMPLMQRALATRGPEAEQKYQQAFLGARRPELERQLGQQKQARDARIAGLGLTGSTMSLLRQQEGNRAANQQRRQLLNQAILGGQQMADRDLKNLMGQFNLAQGLSQQDMMNRIAGAQAASGALRSGNLLEIQKANALNKIAQQEAEQANAAAKYRYDNSPLNRILAGAQSGMSLGAGLGGGLGGIFSSGPNGADSGFSAFVNALDAGSDFGEAWRIGGGQMESNRL